MIGTSGFTRRRRRYSYDLQPCRRARFSTSCDVYNDARERAVCKPGTMLPKPRLRRRSGETGLEETRSGAVIKQQIVYDVVYSYGETAGRLASETTVKSLI